MTLVELSGPGCTACHAQAVVARAWAQARAVPLEVLDVTRDDRGRALAQASGALSVPILCAVEGERIVYAEPGLHGSPATLDRFWTRAESLR